MLVTKPIIMTDATCDMPKEYITNNNIPFLGLMCNFKSNEYEDDFWNSLDYKYFYAELRNGEMPYTMQVNEYRFLKKFRQLLKEHRPIIYIGISSAISGTFNSSKLAREEILDEFKDADITVIDSKGASIGLGLLVYHAVEMAEQGYNKDDIVEWVEQNKNKMNYWFVVDDLKHLQRGGRISSSKAVIGRILDVKPIIVIHKDGALKNVANIRGKKKAFKYLIQRFKEAGIHTQDQLIGISHGDCMGDAMILKNMLEKELPNNKFIIAPLGLGIASHCGSGMVSLCFLGKTRDYE
ncbi:DegV family protein [Clostridium tyrobutyricum]|uniref:DegV family protein n=1 Tax=Clostridium tyrobutyricum TaxID=1519 RepID=UPI0030CCE3B1